MAKMNIQDEIRRITNETAASAAAKALEVAEQAKTKAAEVSTLAIAEALKAATLAATKAADAASAAATIAASTSKDLEYIKKDISDTKADVKEIKDKLDNKYVNKEDFQVVKADLANTINTREKFITKEEVLANENSIQRLSDKIDNLARLVYMGLGGVTALTFVLKFFIK